MAFNYDFDYGVTGLEGRGLPYGEVACARPIVEALPLIPRSEWPDRIRQMDRAKAWLEDKVRGVIPCSNQNPLKFCWAYSTTMADMLKRLCQGHPYVELCPESLGAVTNWRNKGAYMSDALAEIRDKGVCAMSFIDSPHSLNYRRWKPGWQEDRENHRVVEWLELDVPGKAFDAVATCAFLNEPCAVGFGWWGHAISGGYRVLDLGGGKYKLRYRNNWGPQWGDDGFVDFEEGKGTPDLGAFAPCSVTASFA